MVPKHWLFSLCFPRYFVMCVGIAVMLVSGHYLVGNLAILLLGIFIYSVGVVWFIMTIFQLGGELGGVKI